MSSHFLIRASCVLALGLAGLLPAQATVTPSPASLAPSPPDVELDWDPAVVRGQLANGLRYYLVPSAKPAREVHLQLLVGAGSLDESASQSGVAHMVEHMVFHASRRYPAGLRAQMDSLGWRMGADYNAMTNFERTAYLLDLKGSKAAQWRDGLTVLEQIAGHAQIPAAGLARERRIVLEEWRGKLGLRERMDAQRRALLRAGSRYPERPTIGTEASILSQPAEALRAFYRQWYVPNNMQLIVVGAIQPAEVAAEIQRLFGALPAASLPARDYYEPVLSEGLRIARVQDEESQSNQLGWVLRRHESASTARGRVLDQMLDRLLRSSQQAQQAVLPDGVESLSSARGPIGRYSQSLGFSARVADGQHRAGLAAIQQWQERLRRDGFGAAEFEAARQRLRADEGAATVRDSEGWLRALGEALGRERPLASPAQARARHNALLDSLSLAELNQQLRAWLASPDQLVFFSAPGLQTLALPSQAELLAEQARLAAAPLPVLPVADSAPALQLPPPPAPGRIAAEQRHADGRLQVWQLGNGDRLVWLRQANPDGRLYWLAESQAGYLRLADRPGWRLQLASQLVEASGLRAQAPASLAAWQKQHRLNLSQQHDATRLRHSGSASAAELGALFQLYQARQMDAWLAPGLWQEGRADLQRQLARPKAAPRPSLAALRYAADPREAEPQLADLDGLSAEALWADWQQLAAQPVSHYLVGEFDEAELRTLVARHLASLPRSASALAAPPALRSGLQLQRAYQGREPQGRLEFVASQPMAWQPQLDAQLALLSRAYYRALKTVLRDEADGVYRVRAELHYEAQRGQVELRVNFTSDPARLDELWARAEAVLSQPARYLDDKLLAELRPAQGGDSRAGEPLSLLERLAQAGPGAAESALARLPSEALDTPALQALAASLAQAEQRALLLVYPQAAQPLAERAP